jgi:hypothetical protein
MYDRIFSKQWLYDWGENAIIFYYPLILLLTIIVTYFFSRVTKKRIIHTKLRYFINGVFGLISGVFILVFFWIWSDFYLRDGFWGSINNAHLIHARIKIMCREGSCPESDKEVEAIDPKVYKIIISNAKTKYIYNSQNNTYTWFIRPSKYYTAVFDSKNDYDLYSFPGILPYSMQVKVWPPKYDGPWNLLPN